MKLVDFDEAKKLRITRFTHTYSHGDVVEEPDHNLSILTETKSTLIELLELVESQDRGHYQAMVQLVAQQPDDEVEAA